MDAFERLLTLLVAVTGLRIGEVLALRWKHVDWGTFRIRVVSNFVRGKFGEPKSAASKKPVVLHPLVMGLLKNWRETTAYAGDETRLHFRTKTVATRLTPGELAEVEAAAETSSQSLAEWLRETALRAARRRPADPVELLLAEVWALRYTLLMRPAAGTAAG